MANYIKIVKVPQGSGQFITAAGERLDDRRMEEALKGADRFFALWGNNSGPYCLWAKTFKSGWTEVPDFKERPVAFGCAVLWAAKDYNSERAVMIQEIDRWITKQ